MGAVLVLVGVLGFVSNPIIYQAGAVFGANMVQSVVHLLGGAAGLWLGYREGVGARNYNIGLGAVAVLLAVLGFVPQTATLLADLLAVNMNMTYLHAAIAVSSLAVAFAVKE